MFICSLRASIGICSFSSVLWRASIDISPITVKRSKSKISTAVKDYMLICDQPVSFDNFKVLASRNSEFHLKIKESLLVLCDQPVLNKTEASLPVHLFDLLY